MNAGESIEADFFAMHTCMWTSTLMQPRQLVPVCTIAFLVRTASLTEHPTETP